ncbi:MAG: GTPase HflX [Ignavibacteriales bacterium]|mgnify:CR=1 FL=1|nr:MAG: GTPase HflX [Ignavibacteriaceae bacterium]MBW7873421.1 GTPase HflX [Ignavibacteria bacterium]MCZ2142112.1 GTPase HflX [Ignavibacteriales bacterium]OQY75694.1 MAG: GTPase HflX [Ignavibacteriales bacterium UTCHB3]MBV6444848.1 GTPase HflX [Ignavibacteriaceae bacterium]
MIDIKVKKTERAILVGVRIGQTPREEAQEHIDELEELLATAGGETIIKIMQDRQRLDVAFYVGKGKAEEILALIEPNEIDLIVFDDDLSTIQMRNLSNLFNKKVVDRSGLILDIFASRARTKEAKTQVELAQLKYMLPRLTRAWTHLSKQYGGIGTKGPGETQIETDRRIIRDRIAMLTAKLKEIETNREIQVKNRKDMVKISLVGYTNAGKSTIFNLLTESDVFAEDKLFATLDSTTRVFRVDKTHTALLSDTVGFIRKLPAHLVASFKSTLNEVRDADILLHVVDITHPFYEDHISVVNQTLKDLHFEDKVLLHVFNKVDILEEKERIEFVNRKYENVVIVSAVRGFRIEELKNMIRDIIESKFGDELLELSYAQSGLVATIHSLAKVNELKYEDDKIVVKFRADKVSSQKIKRLAEG